VDVELRRVAVYVRALTAERGASQRERLEAHAAGREWELTRIYEDVGTDARLGQQPSLSRALAELADFDALILLRLDRLGRSVSQTIGTIKRLRSARVDLVLVEEGLDTAEPGGRVAATLLEEVGGWEGGRAWSHGGGWQTLREHGFAPATMIDVGAADGTEDLYAAFPGAYHVLIEPLREFEQPLDQVLERYQGERVMTAVGSETGSAEINVDPSLLMSSLLAKASPRPEQAREVPITTLDALLAERSWSPPFGLKIDTEGFEHHVIAGAARVLERTQFVVAEVSVSKRFEHSHTPAQLIELMRTRGFAVRDVLDAGASALGIHADLLFTPARGQS
jgi:FkbM family methyltransferase